MWYWISAIAGSCCCLGSVALLFFVLPTLALGEDVWLGIAALFQWGDKKKKPPEEK